MILCLLPETLSPREMKILKIDPEIAVRGRLQILLRSPSPEGWLVLIIQEEPENTKPRTLKLILVLLEDYYLNSVTNK